MEQNLVQHIRPGYNLGPWWSPRELVLLGTDGDDVIAARVGRTPAPLDLFRRRGRCSASAPARRS